MANTALITIFCPDRPGLVAAITGNLFDQGANFGDTGFTVLGSGAEFAAVCDLPDGLDLDTVKRSLQQMPELAEAEIGVRPFAFDAEHTQVNHEITVSGGDQPGLIARLCEVLGSFGANIVTLNAGPGPGRGMDEYVIRITAWIPERRATACLTTMANTVEALQLRCNWKSL
ncbi:MAG: ACT domain-containing protein [Alphaproteobacteria bacterium]|nr:ACT domain-containing protein [Alphaproteobacteria bacterium]MDP6815324.1 ACT domain-containing protein [Alphaproteobacteria bacterium]